MSASVLQDEFIQNCITNKSKCSVYLINGIKLQGQISAADGESLSLVADSSSQLVYKHAISTIVPSR